MMLERGKGMSLQRAEHVTHRSPQPPHKPSFMLSIPQYRPKEARWRPSAYQGNLDSVCRNRGFEQLELTCGFLAAPSGICRLRGSLCPTSISTVCRSTAGRQVPALQWYSFTGAPVPGRGGTRFFLCPPAWPSPRPRLIQTFSEKRNTKCGGTRPPTPPKRGFKSGHNLPRLAGCTC